MGQSFENETVVMVNERSLNRLLRSVSLSQGQFSLVLVCCNSSQLRQQVFQTVQKDSEITIESLILSPQTTSLYTALLDYVQTHSPSALMILGLEAVENLDGILSSTNQMRDEFRKQFNFPMIVWITDELATQLIRLAPDFKSWAAATIKFQLTIPELFDYLKLQANTLFTLAELKIKAWEADTQQVLTSSAFRHHPSDFAKGSSRRRELELHWQDLQNQDYELYPALEACRQFIFAQDCDRNDRSEIARQHYQQALALLQHEHLQKELRGWSIFPHQHSTLNRQGIVLFHIALTYCIQAARNPGLKTILLQEAKSYFEQSQHTFEQGGRPDLVSGVVSHLGEVLQGLKLWDELQKLAFSGLKMHLVYGTACQLAQDYSFMAEVALQQGEWEQALTLAQLALTILPESNQTAHRGQCLLLLARCYQHQREWQQAQQELEFALKDIKPQYNPQLYLEILGELRKIYYHQGEYRQAFRIKKKQREIEHQYGFRAFIGAAQLQPPKQAINPSSLPAENRVTIAEEMMASCRQHDIQNLLHRLSRDDHKLIIIHGRSGVGKSSLVNAGLVPALKTTVISARFCLPVVIQNYTEWGRELEISLAHGLQNCGSLKQTDESMKTLWYNVINPSSISVKSVCNKNTEIVNSLILNPSSFLLTQLKNNADLNLITILIFDQFEEFFFVSNHQEKRKIFYEFLKLCLDLPFVKIVFSLREDYLHYLLECDYLLNLEAINNNILDRKNRYHLRDFSLAEAKTVIERLTQRAKLRLEPALINALVTDLADERHEVRPIELQVVGAQLQEEGKHGITTLEAYQKLGMNPKAELIKHSIEQVIQDCGQENESAAWEVLFALTDERFTRPIKTKAELLTVIRKEQGIVKKSQNPHHEEPEAFIDVILESGLLLRRREEPDDRYQLLHDYLVLPIRQRYAIQEQKRQQEIRATLHQVQAEKYQAEVALEKMGQEQLLQRNKLLQQCLGVSMVVALLFGFTAKIATNQERRAEEQKQLANLATLTASSEALFFSEYKFDALMESLRAARQFQQLKAKTPGNPELTTMETRIAATLQQAVYGIGERNRLEGHQDAAWDVSFSPDGQTLASASFDKTVKLWTPNGQLLKTLVGHTASVTSVSFSPDGQLLASASRDGTVKLWPLERVFQSSEGVIPLTLKGHRNRVSSVSFSPDGDLIASGSEDCQLKLWTREGQLLRTVQSSVPLMSVVFSPDGEALAIALEDGTVKILDLQGTILYNLDHSHNPEEAVYKVRFSPNGQWIATVGQDHTLKLWTRRGQLLKTLKGDSSIVYGLSFSPDSQRLATSTDDRNIYLWTVDGRLLNQWQGHGDKVTNVQFSPDGKTLASSSYDKTVKLWNPARIPLKTLTGHQNRVLGVSFSPSGEMFASASQDKTVKLWSRTGALLTTLAGYEDRVATVSFSPDGELLATASYDHTVKLWKLTQDSDLAEHPQGGLLKWRNFNGIFGKVNSEKIASPFQKKRVSVESIKLLNSWIAHDDSIMSITFCPDGEMIATASKDQTVKLWNRQGELLQTLIGHNAWVNSVAFSPNDQVIATASDDGMIKLWNHQGTLLKTIVANQGYVLGVSFSPDGQVMASAGYDNTVKLWDSQGNYLKTLLNGSSDSVTSVVFSPDGQFIASASFDGTVKLWSRQDGTLLKTLLGHRDSVMAVSFSPDGQVLVSASRDKTLIMWNLDLDNLIDRACDWVDDYLRTNPKIGSSDRHLCYL